MITTLSESLVRRFFQGFDPGLDDECWLWKRCIVAGYGQISSGPQGDRRRLRAHRVSYEIHHGRIPDGLCVCHSCDVRTCVNPAHLFLGTNMDNTRDMISKGRFRHGQRTPRALCPNGHQYDAMHKQGYRICKTCRRAYDVQRRRRIKSTISHKVHV